MKSANIHSCVEIKFDDRIEKYTHRINRFGLIISHKEILPNEDKVEKPEIRIWEVKNIPLISKIAYTLLCKKLTEILKKKQS
jgi:hypothetical protein